MTAETITVPEIHCDHCKMSLESAVGGLEGVSEATVDVAAHTVSVSYDGDAVDRAAIINAIEEQGYEVPA